MSWQQHLDEYLDVFISICAIGGGLLVFGLSAILGLGQYGLGLAFIIGPIAYLLYRRLSDGKSPSSLPTRVFYAGTGLWTTAVVIATLTGFRAAPGRPLLHYFAATVAFATILIDILYHSQLSPSRQSNLRAVILGKLITISLIYRTGRFYSVSTIPGNDVHKHLERAATIANTGFPASQGDPTFSKYVAAPIFHIAITTLSKFGLTEQQVVLALVVLFVFVTALVAFKLGQVLATPEVGLFAALFVSGSDIFILRGVASVTPSLLTVIFFMLVLLLLFQQSLNSNYIYFSAFSLMLLITLTHHLSMVVAMIILTSISVGILLAQYVSIRVQQTNGVRASLVFTLVGVVVMVVHWTLTPSAAGTLFERGIYRVLATLQSLGASSSGYASAFSSAGFVSNLLYSLGQSTLLCLGVFGILTWLHRDFRTDRRSGALFGTFALFVVIYPGTLVGLDTFLLPHRILVFLMVFVTILAGVACSELIARSDRVRVLTVVVIIGLLFASLTAPFVIEDDPVYNEEQMHRASLTESEMNAFLFTSRVANEETVYVDPLVRQPQIISGQRQADIPRFLNFMMYPQNETWEENSLVVVREVYRERGYKFGVPGTFSAGSSGAYSPRPLQGCDKTLIYETASTEVYRLPDGCNL
ncbi:hypothetical protein [Natrinema sp. 1APR25-10V2]|uniref:hypothetical protein n=1 Tax=Natrinema sp. 1APR25-10V2 TaxID=2951081 RepID=UPI0028769743|nr:hypothetical protein [Natrinema sp. 1APR25-10V2]MDS0475694.1 hypothetical protein [Natrinema sp. 1APR25-10V2]